MNRKTSVFLLLLLATLFTGCEMNTIEKGEKTILLREEMKGTRLTISVTKGDAFSDRMQAGPFIFNVIPQIVIWTEDAEGTPIETLYITGAEYAKMRHAGKEKMGEAFYRECFPIWASRMDAKKKALPSKERPYTDAVTSATPTSDFSVNTVLSGDTTAVIMCEVNKSSDYNATYTQETSGWVGQPSVLYSAKITNTAKGATYTMRFIGHSGTVSNVSSPTLSPDRKGITTADAQLRAIHVTFE